MGQLDGRTVLVTGASHGVGALVTQRIRAAGGRVIGVDGQVAIDADEMILADLGHPSGIEALCRSIVDRPVDILINLAFGTTVDMSIEQLSAGYAIGLIAPAMIARALLPGMEARGQGQIVTVGAPFGDTPLTGFAKWSSARAGLKGLSAALRGELAGSGVVVTHIEPRGGHDEDTQRLADRIVDTVAGRACMSVAERPVVALRAI